MMHDDLLRKAWPIDPVTAEAKWGPGVAVGMNCAGECASQERIYTIGLAGCIATIAHRTSDNQIQLTHFSPGNQLAQYDAVAAFKPDRLIAWLPDVVQGWPDPCLPKLFDCLNLAIEIRRYEVERSSRAERSGMLDYNNEQIQMHGKWDTVLYPRKNNFSPACEGCGGRCCTRSFGFGSISLLPDEAKDPLFAPYARKQVRAQFGYEIPLTGDCPFLEEDTRRCSIYAQRPFACRGFICHEHATENSQVWDAIDRIPSLRQHLENLGLMPPHPHRQTDPPEDEVESMYVSAAEEQEPESQSPCQSISPQ